MRPLLQISAVDELVIDLRFEDLNESDCYTLVVNSVCISSWQWTGNEIQQMAKRVEMAEGRQVEMLRLFSSFLKNPKLLTPMLQAANRHQEKLKSTKSSGWWRYSTHHGHLSTKSHSFLATHLHLILKLPNLISF